MTEALTRLFRRTKKVDDPEYLPPYFWHRYWVWRHLIVILCAVSTSVLFDLLWPLFVDGPGGLGRTMLVSLFFTIVLQRVPNRLRLRWVTQQHEEVRRMLLEQEQDERIDAYSVDEATTRLQLFTEDLRDYANLNPFVFSRLSVRRANWQGNGLQFDIYQKRRPKRIITFHHDL